MCDRNLPPAEPAARICSYECTFCVDCVETVLRNVCPNCGGGFAPRPIRPRQAWRAGTGLLNDPPDSRRRQPKYSLEEIGHLTAKLSDTSPAER
jgi:hypothetical protein